MTCSPTAPEGAPLSFTLPEGLLALVRLLAREAARSDFAARCTEQRGELAYV